MKRLLFSWGAGLCLLVASPGQASAQFVVSDPTNLIQNTTTAISTAAGVINQGTQILNQLKMYEAMLKNLKTLSFEDLHTISMSLNKIQQLLNATRAIGYRYQAIDRQFAAVYGKYGPPKNQSFEAQNKAWNKQTDDALLDAMRTGGLVAGQNAQLAAGFARLENSSRGASGSLQAIQASNEMLAVIIKQNQQMSQMILTDSRAKQSYMMQQRRSQQAATLRTRKAMGSGMGERRIKDEPVLLKDF